MSPIQLLVILLTFGRFTGAADVDYDMLGNVYVVDREGNALVKFTPEGDSVRAVSGFGDGSLQFDEPVAVAAHSGNDVYVADYNNHRVQRFNRLLDHVATIATRDDPDERKRFGYPRDIALSRQGDLYVVDGENRRILRISPLGKPLYSFGDINAGEGRLLDPSAVEVDDRGNVYVIDRARIALFDPFGTWLRDLALPESFHPSSIAIDRDTLTLADSTLVMTTPLGGLGVTSWFELPVRPRALRLGKQGYVAVEPKRLVILAMPAGEVGDPEMPLER